MSSTQGKKVKVLVTQSCLTLCDPMDYSPPGSSIHGIIQASIEWVAIPFSRVSSQLRDQTWIFCIAGRFFTIWATRKIRYLILVLAQTKMAEIPFPPVTSTLWDPWFLLSSAPSNLSNIQSIWRQSIWTKMFDWEMQNIRLKARITETNWILGIWLVSKFPWVGSSGWVRIIRQGLKERDMIMQCKHSHDKWGKRQHEGKGKRNPPIHSTASCVQGCAECLGGQN